MNDQELIKKERKATAPDLYQNYARAERIEEYKGIIDEEIDHLRDMRENELDADRWLKLDNDIDALLIQKENAAAEIDAALDQIVERELAPKTAHFDSDLGVKLPPAEITTMKQLMEAKERSFNRRYYGNRDGLPEWEYK